MSNKQIPVMVSEDDLLKLQRAATAAIKEIDSLRAKLEVAIAAFANIRMLVKDVQTPGNRIAIAVDECAKDALTQVGIINAEKK